MKTIKVFLGGTCNDSKWRDELIKLFDENVDYFNPVVEDWTEECMKEEIKQRKNCDLCLYVITPRMTGLYSIAEAVEDSIKRPDKTIFCYLYKDHIIVTDGKIKSTIGDVTYDCNPPSDNKNCHLSFSEGQIKSLKQISKLILNNGGICFDSIDDVAEYINTYVKTIYEIKK